MVSWKTLNNKVNFHHINGSANSLLNEINSQWVNFLLHRHLTVEKNKYTKALRFKFKWNYIYCCTNRFCRKLYDLSTARSTSCHGSNQQAKVFTVHLMIRSINKNIAIIHDYMSHNTSFVHVAQGILTDFIKNKCPLVKKINYSRLVF
jgi:hypothetical protein